MMNNGRARDRFDPQLPEEPRERYYTGRQQAMARATFDTRLALPGAAPAGSRAE